MLIVVLLAILYFVMGFGVYFLCLHYFGKVAIPDFVIIMWPIALLFFVFIVLDELICKVVNNKMSKILNTYLYGSYVYGTNDSESDTDYIVIVDNQNKSEDQLFAGRLNITSYPFEYFQHLVNEHSVSALECIFLPDKLKIELQPPEFSLNMEKLRRSFSEKSSNSWVKAKKKIDLHDEHRIGRKSLFHSLRILNFGIQIAKYGKIIDYSSASDIWGQIQKQNHMSWEKYKEFWQPRYNELRSQFREIFPLK